MQPPLFDFLSPKLLNLSYIRGQLIRLEDTIIFDLIERSQYPLCEQIYSPTANAALGVSLLDYLLRGHEKLHAQLRRYEAADEIPFFPDVVKQPASEALPPKVRFSTWDGINVNDKVREEYVKRIMPGICCSRQSSPLSEQEDEESEVLGSAAVCDIAVLQALSRRIHFGKFVAEAKFRAEQPRFEALIENKDTQGIMAAITDEAVERKVLQRLAVKAKAYSWDPSENEGNGRIDVDGVVGMYEDWVIPLTKEVEVEYLLKRLDGQSME